MSVATGMKRLTFALSILGGPVVRVLAIPEIGRIRAWDLAVFCVAWFLFTWVVYFIAVWIVRGFRR